MSKSPKRSKSRDKIYSGNTTPKRIGSPNNVHNTPSTQHSSAKYFNGYLEGIEDRNQFAESFVDSLHISEFDAKGGNPYPPNKDAKGFGNQLEVQGNMENKQWFEDSKAGPISPRW